MFLFLNYYNLSLFLGGLVALLSGAAVYFSNHRKPENTAWMLLNISTAIWSFGYFGMITSSDVATASLFNWVLHIGAILIPLFYLIFIIKLTKPSLSYKRPLFLTAVIAIIFLLKSASLDLVRAVIPKEPFAFAPDAGPLYLYFTFYFFATVAYALHILSGQIRKTKGQEATRLRHVLFSSIFGFIGGGFVFFLTFNIWIPPYPLALFTFYPLIIAYAMLRHKLFDIKVASTEILTGSIWITLLFRTLLSENPNEQIISLILLLLTIIFGVLLIQTVYREVEQREKIEKLAGELEKTNVLLEGANDRLKELDQLKNEFVSMATHQIRGPVTAIKGYASMLLEGDYGAVPELCKKPVETILQSSASLAGIVQDFLDVSRIEQGRMKYEFTDFDVSKLVNDVIAELRPNIEKKGLTIKVTAEPDIKIHADVGKVKQVLENLIDNCLKYTLQGGITIGTGKSGLNARISIADTGVGISKETLPKLFQKFSRAEDASKANLLGTGLGLYVARQLLEKQGGTIRAESEGEGRGTTFIVELPLL